MEDSAMITLIGYGALSIPVILASIDLNGFFTSSNFLTVLANAISGVLLALFNLLTFGSAAV